MKNRYTQYIGQLQDLIGLEYPSQKLYPGIIQDIYKLTKLIERGENINNISFLVQREDLQMKQWIIKVTFQSS